MIIDEKARSLLLAVSSTCLFARFGLKQLSVDRICFRALGNEGGVGLTIHDVIRSGKRHCWKHWASSEVEENSYLVIRP